MCIVGTLSRLVRQFGNSERGVTVVEYAIMLVLIALAVSVFGSDLSGAVLTKRVLPDGQCAFVINSGIARLPLSPPLACPSFRRLQETLGDRQEGCGV